MRSGAVVVAALVAMIALAILVRVIVADIAAPTAVATTHAARPDDDFEAEAPAGTLVGVRRGDVVSFLGVPYALPPTGARRFAPPVPMPRSETPIDARTPGPLCPQLRRAHGPPEPGEERMALVGDEDCLRLDVWTRADGTARPVMVFFHGGAFQRGGRNPRLPIEASSLVQSGEIVLVMVDYRLGTLGMLSLEALAHESESGSTGNQAIRDQIAALGWVHDNIAALGGDPARVTIFGESAGGESVCAMIASPLADGLFAGAIVESGGGCARWPTLHEGVDGRLSGLARGAEIAAAAGCADASEAAACMRALDVETLVRAGTRGERWLGMPVFGPVLDGTVLPETAYARLARGGTDVPLIVGNNAEEGSAFTPFGGVREEGYERRLRQIAGDRADAALAIWPSSLAGDPAESFRRALGEMLFSCPAEELARAAAAGPDPVFLYRFSRHPTSALGEHLGAFHTVELAYLFAAPPAHPERWPEDLVVGSALRAAWTSFASRGTPVATPDWPAYRVEAPAIYDIDATNRILTDPSEGRCARAREAGLSFSL